MNYSEALAWGKPSPPPNDRFGRYRLNLKDGTVGGPYSFVRFDIGYGYIVSSNNLRVALFCDGYPITYFDRWDRSGHSTTNYSMYGVNVRHNLVDLYHITFGFTQMPPMFTVQKNGYRRNYFWLVGYSPIRFVTNNKTLLITDVMIQP